MHKSKETSRIYLSILIFFILWSILAVGIHQVTRDHTLGTDFYVFYLSGRFTFIDGLNPYGNNLQIQTQNAILGRLAKNGEDKLGFAYPLYSLFAIFPLVFFEFAWAQAIWMSFLIVLMITTIFIGFPKSPVWIPISVLFLYPITFGVLLGNFVIVISCITIIAILKLFNQNMPTRIEQIILGILIAWCTIKPQFIWLITFMILIHAFIKKQTWFLISFFISFVCFNSVSFLVMHDWPLRWIEQVLEYRVYNQSDVTFIFFLKQFLNNIIAINIVSTLIGIMIIIITFWLIKLWHKKNISFLLFFSWLALITYLVHPRGKSYEQIIYILPMLFWVLNPTCGIERGRKIFWLCYLLYTWVIFVVSIPDNALPVMIEFTILPFVAWFIYIFYQERNNRIQITP